MKTDYLCPKCKKPLLVNEKIILLGSKKGTKNKSLMLLSPELGDYSSIHHNSVHFDKGELVDFCCPICHEDISAHEVNNKLARLIIVDEKYNNFEVLFSKVSGEHSTYKVSAKDSKFYGINDLYSEYIKRSILERFKG